MKKELITLKINDLLVDEHNEKIHTEENNHLIEASIKQVGYVTPVIIDEDNRILSGHGRVSAMKNIGKETELEVLMVSGLSEDQKNRFRLFDNQSARTGYLDKGMVVKTVSGIMDEDVDFDVSVLSFDGLVDVFSESILDIDMTKKAFKTTVDKKACFVIVCDDKHREDLRLEMEGRGIKCIEAKYVK